MFNVLLSLLLIFTEILKVICLFLGFLKTAGLYHLTNLHMLLFAGSLESAYSLNWGALQFLGKGGGETLALL